MRTPRTLSAADYAKGKLHKRKPKQAQKECKCDIEMGGSKVYTTDCPVHTQQERG